MKKRNYLNSLYKLGILSLVVVVLWILVDVYTVVARYKPIQVDKKVLAPFSPKIEREVLEKLLKRKEYPTR